MAENFISSQLDYILFVHGLAFIIMAIICQALARQNRDRLPFSLLALFGALKGADELLEMLALSLPDPFLFRVVRLTLLAGSFVALFEFGRQALQIQTKDNDLGSWIYYPLVFLTAIGALDGINGIVATSGYSLGIPSAVICAMALWREAEIRNSPESKYLELVSIAMLAYGLAIGLFPGEASFFPASSFNQQWFSRTFGFPIRLISAVLRSDCGFRAGTFLSGAMVRIIGIPTRKVRSHMGRLAHNCAGVDNCRRMGAHSVYWKPHGFGPASQFTDSDQYAGRWN